MSLSESIKNIRKKSLLSQEDIAKVLHVSVGSINRWENGMTKPNFAAIKSIKTFCKGNNLLFENIESEWLKVEE